MGKQSKRSKLGSSAAAISKLFKSSVKSKDSRNSLASSNATLISDSVAWRSCSNGQIIDDDTIESGKLKEINERFPYLRLTNNNRSTVPTFLSTDDNPRRASSLTLNCCPETELSSTLISLVIKADWESLRHFLATESGAACASALMTANEDNKGNIDDINSSYTGDSTFMVFHKTLRNHPPLDIVASLMRFNPLLTVQIDSLGRTPLHVAAAYGASPQVIRFLLQQDAGAAAKLDCEGKTPLHLCCEHCCSEGTCDPGLGKGILVKGPLSEVLKMLTKAFPDSLNREDEMEMSPLEHAIVNGADVRVVKLLQKLSVKEWKKTVAEPSADEECFNSDTENNALSTTNDKSMRSEISSMAVEAKLMARTSDDSIFRRPAKKSETCNSPRVSNEDYESFTSTKIQQTICSGFCEASLLKAIVKASSEGSSDKNALPSASLYKQLSVSMHGRVTASRSVPALRRRSSCNAAA